MNKKIILVLLLVVGVPVAWRLLSPLWNNIALNEASPIVKDNLESMDAGTMKSFKEQTEAMKDKVMESGDSMASSESIVLAKAVMTARAHDVKGEALLIKTGDKKILRFENLETINGPDLRIYLSRDLSADDIVDLGPIRATEGNVNYDIPAGTDLSKYKNALIWCRAFGVLFSYAQL